jgi:hypothetical protein
MPNPLRDALRRKIAVLLIVMMWSIPSFAILTKTQNTQLMEWTNIPLGSIVSCDANNLNLSYDTTIHIDAAIVGTTAHLGVPITVQIGSEADVNDSWTDVCRFICLIGTAFKSDVAADEAVGQTVLSVTNPATGNLNHNGKFILLYPADDVNVANTEIAYQTANSGDAGDTITVLNNIEHALTTDTDVYTCDGAGGLGANECVITRAIQVPISTTKVRVIINNAYGATGSTIVARVRCTKVTGL